MYLEIITSRIYIKQCIWKRAKSGQINARTLLQVQNWGAGLTQNISSQIKKHQLTIFRKLTTGKLNQRNSKLQKLMREINFSFHSIYIHQLDTNQKNLILPSFFPENFDVWSCYLGIWNPKRRARPLCCACGVCVCNQIQWSETPRPGFHLIVRFVTISAATKGSPTDHREANRHKCIHNITSIKAGVGGHQEFICHKHQQYWQIDTNLHKLLFT